MVRPTTLVKFAAISAALVAACSGSNTTRPKSANLPALQLAKGDGYRRVYPAFVTQSVIAASEIGSDGNAKLEYLVKGAEPVVLSTKAEPYSVKMPLAEPASALFLDEPSRDEAIGVLKFVDLTQKPVAASSVKKITDGTNVPSDGVFFGANGHQILFISGFSSRAGTGKLEWSDGSTSKSVSPGVTPASVVFSGARDLAVFVGDTTDGGTGTLYAVTTATAEKKKLAENVLVYGYERDLAYSLSTDGSTVAYTTADGRVYRVPTGSGEPTKISDKGASPAISPDGQTVVFYAEDKLFTWTGGSATYLADAPLSVRPQFSPDRSWVVYFGPMTFAGQGAGAVGDAYVVPATGNATPVKLAESVGWDTVKFNATSSRIVAVGDLKTNDGHPFYEGLGNLYVSQPGEASRQVSKQTQPGNVATLEQTDSLAFIASIQPGTTTGSMFVSAPDGQQATKFDPPVVLGSLKVPKGFDSMVFLGDPSDDLVDELFRPATLYGMNAKHEVAVVKNAESGVIQVVFGRDGRPVVVVARGDNAGIWTLPAP